MISPETLRRYPFFNFLDHDQLRQIAMLTDEVTAEAGDTLFEIGHPADALYLLMDGEVDLHYVVVDELKTGKRQDYLVGSINPGEILGISTLIEPKTLTATAVVTQPSRLLRLDGEQLQQLMEKDTSLAYTLQRKISRATMDRLHSTRIELLAATAEQPRRGMRA